MTTWASAGYVTRLMEVAALADVVVYVASDERYNDEVPTQFLHLLIKAGKAVVVVLTKVREANAAAARRSLPPRNPGPAAEVAQRLRRPPCRWSRSRRCRPRNDADPTGARSEIPRAAAQPDSRAVRLRHRVPALRTVTNAAKYLTHAGEGLLEVARRDLAEYDAWKTTVAAGKAEFEERYRHEFLSGEQFRRFDRYRDEMMDLLELPGAGRILGGLDLAVAHAVPMDARLRRGPDGRGRKCSTSPKPPCSNARPHRLARQAAGRSAPPCSGRTRSGSRSRRGSRRNWRRRPATGSRRSTARLNSRRPTNSNGPARRWSRDWRRTRSLLYTLRGGKFAIDLVADRRHPVPDLGAELVSPAAHLRGVSVTHRSTELVVRGVAETARRRVRHQRETLVASDH